MSTFFVVYKWLPFVEDYNNIIIWLPLVTLTDEVKTSIANKRQILHGLD